MKRIAVAIITLAVVILTPARSAADVPGESPRSKQGTKQKSGGYGQRVSIALTCAIIACVVAGVAVGLMRVVREMRVWQANRERRRQAWEHEPEPKEPE